MANTLLHSDSMVEYNRDKKSNCRECENSLGNFLTAIPCIACTWRFHPKCTKLNGKQLECLGLKDSTAQLSFICGWCKTTIKQITPNWLAYDTQSYFKWIEAQLADERKSWKDKVKSLKDMADSFKGAMSDIKRSTDIERRKFETNVNMSNVDVVEKIVFDNLKTEFNELVTVHAKCVNEIKRLKEHSDGLAKQMKYAPMPGDHANKIDRPTYAEALKNATNGIARRIEVDERNEEFMQKITTANVKEIPGLTKIIPRGNKVATLVFENEAAVTEFETQSVVKFPKVFKINKTREYTPHMKIVCIDDIDTDCNELIAAAKNGNFLDDSVQLVREYTIRTPRRIYRNFIVSCTVDLLKEYLSNGVIIGNERRRCYESVRTLQCFRCYDYGHFSSNCKNNVVCRKCGENHVSTACTDLSGKFTCLNCKLAGKDYTHSITSENCPRRIERVNGLIDFLVKKKKL